MNPLLPSSCAAACDGPNTDEADGAQRIGKTVDQRRLGADDHEVDLVRIAERRDRAVIGRVERDQLGVLGDTGVARGGVELTSIGEQAGLRELPRQRMLASARSQQQDVHARPFR